MHGQTESLGIHRIETPIFQNYATSRDVVANVQMPIKVRVQYRA